MKSEQSFLLISTGLTGPPSEVQISSNILSPQMYHHISELPSPPLSPLSPRDHVSGGMARAKSYSIFEDSSDYSDRHQYYRSHHAEQDKESRPLSCKHAALPEVVISGQDWIQVQSHISSLEWDNSNVSRTNQLLYQELDKMNSQMRRLTTQGGEHGRNEYEFLVQQIELLHRQLQLAHNQMDQSNHSGDGNKYSRELNQREQPDTTMQLQSEVKELTKSLKSWQAAFQQAEEKYRRKCEGERTLKQTLRKRETELSGLVEKLTKYEGECENSIANYNELLRLSSELEALKEKKQLANSSVALTPTADKATPVRSKKRTGGVKPTPSFYPEGYTEERVTITVGQLTMAMLSWAFAYVLP